MYDHIKPESVFLDFGCSTGYFGQLIKQDKKCTVYGAEISDDRKQAAKVLDGVYPFDFDGQWPAELYERKYDYLFFGDVLEHLKDPAAALIKCQKLLKKDGIIFVSVPNIAHMSIRLELLQGNFEYEPMGILDNTHLKYFTLHSFGEMAATAGYAAELVDYTLNDYSKEVLTQLLNKAKVSPKPGFWDVADSIEARAFQFKFILRPTKQAVVSVKKAVKPHESRDTYVNDLKDKVKNLTKHAKEQAKIINAYHERIQNMQQQLQDMSEGNLATRAKKALRILLKPIK